MKTLLLSIISISFCLAEQKPNIIYILADDLGYGDLSCYGQKKFQTPNIDRIATEGMKFNNHYSGNTVCSPSRAVLMTGIESGRNYLRGNSGPAQAALPEQLTTLPEILQKAGYATGAFGKWGLGITNSEKKKQLPSTHGFDDFCGWKSQAIAHTYYPTSYVQNGKEIPLEKGTYVDPIIWKAARDFITKNVEAEKPFFCYIPTAIPHAAMHAPKELHEKWRKKLPEWDSRIGKYGAGPGEDTPDVINPVAGFAAMMEHFDNQVGLILDQLVEYGIDENTLVIFASDNGAHKEGGHHYQFWDSTGGLRGHKRDMHEGGIRTPMMARWKGQIEAGSETDHLSGFHDVLPTLVGLVDQEIPEVVTGLSFLPTLIGEGEQKEHEYLYIEHAAGRKLLSLALRFGDWKVHQWANKPLELYNLKDDPQEKKDLANSPEHRKTLEKARDILSRASTPINELEFLR